VDRKLSISQATEAIRKKALELGFADCGFSRAEYLDEDAARLSDWLEAGSHAEMGYMANHFGKRTDPTQLVEGAQSVISVLYNYYTDKKQTDPEAPVISKYAYGKDYHKVMKDLLYTLFDTINEIFPQAAGRVFVDSAPVLDRAWARNAGLGWIGKNSCLISRSSGSFVFIGEIILNQELEYNQIPESDFCGSCNRCVEACPTGAILNDRTLDSHKCISYQTIEKRGEISPELEGLMEARIFGCDICQDVCPWNRKAVLHSEPQFEPSDALMEMTEEQWGQLDQEAYEKIFTHSPVERAGFSKLQSNFAFLQK